MAILPPQNEQTSYNVRPQPQSPTICTNHFFSRALGASGPVDLQQAGIAQHSLGAGVLLSDRGRRPPGNVRDALGEELVQVMLNHLLPLGARENQDTSAPGQDSG